MPSCRHPTIVAYRCFPRDGASPVIVSYEDYDLLLSLLACLVVYEKWLPFNSLSCHLCEIGRFELAFIRYLTLVELWFAMNYRRLCGESWGGRAHMMRGRFLRRPMETTSSQFDPPTFRAATLYEGEGTSSNCKDQESILLRRYHVTARFDRKE